MVRRQQQMGLLMKTTKTIRRANPRAFAALLLASICFGCGQHDGTERKSVTAAAEQAAGTMPPLDQQPAHPICANSDVPVTLATGGVERIPLADDRYRVPQVRRRYRREEIASGQGLLWLRELSEMR